MRKDTQKEGYSINSVRAINESIYTANQWFTLVRICEKNNPHIVLELYQEICLYLLRDIRPFQKTPINLMRNDKKNIYTIECYLYCVNYIEISIVVLYNDDF